MQVWRSFDICGNRHSCVCLSFAVKLTSVSSRPRCTALIKQKRSQKRIKYKKSFFQNDGGTGCATLRRRFTHCLRQPAFLRLPFVCGQTHICEFSPSLHSTNKTKKVSKETFFVLLARSAGLELTTF